MTSSLSKTSIAAPWKTFYCDPDGNQDHEYTCKHFSDFPRPAALCGFLFQREKVFFGHGSANALDEAAYLILHTLHLPLDKIDPFLDARLLPEEIEAVLAMIERRARPRAGIVSDQ
jgi:hypothetical protein